MEKQNPLERLLAVVAQLRSEEGGCPWDREQTHQTLIPFLQEESAEVIDAIEENNPEALKEELADLLFQVLLHSQIATESGDFDFQDVVALLEQKLIRRHPHVFAGKVYHSVEAQKADWQRIKAAERAEKGLPALKDQSLLAGIPNALAALDQASKLQARAAKVGFDWDNIADVIAKVDEEKLELLEAIELNDPNEIEAELGDLLFSIVNLSRFLGIEATVALNRTNQKFKRRFNYIERHAPVPLTAMSLAELDRYWEEAKAIEKQSHLSDQDAFLE